jgi:hypothetical protein
MWTAIWTTIWTHGRSSFFWSAFPKNAVFMSAVGFGLIFPSFGCSKIAGWAIDKAIGDDAGLAEEALAGGGSTTTSTKKVCDLITDAEVEAASGKKILKKEDGGSDSCTWTLSGGLAQDGSGASIALQVIPELALKVIPVLGEQKAIPGLGTKAEWSGGMAPNLRVHMKDGKVLNFLLVDPQLMMKNTGITEKKIDNNTSAVNMEYPELEKEAIALGKAAAGRY